MFLNIAVMIALLLLGLKNRKLEKRIWFELF